jgi:TolA-binding protein
MVSEFRDAAASHYRQAISQFDEVVRLADSANPWGRAARLLIGICYIELNEPDRAGNHLRNLIETFPASPEAAAASFLLGEQDRTMANYDAAFRSFARTFENLRQNPSYASLWLPKEMIVERCAAMVRDDIEKQNYLHALRLLNMLTSVMPPDEILRLQGESYESWGRLLQAQAETTFGEQGDQIARDAESKWRSAGTAFATLAQWLSDTQEFSELLWRGAENYHRGKDYRRGAIEYQKFSRANLVDHRPEVNLRLGEMYLHLDFLSEAAFTLEDALHRFPSHHLVPQIRLVLSHVYYEQQEWDKAKSLLQLNLVGDIAPISDIYRDSMYELGRISFVQGDLNSAIPYLEDVIKVHPEAIQVADATYMLALAHLRQAEDQLNELEENFPEAVRRSMESNVRINRHRALLYLEQTERILTDRQQAIGLTEAERLMLRNVHFKTCTTLLNMEQYEEAIQRLNTVATMYQDRAEALDALIKMEHALRMVGKDTEAQTTLRQAEVILNQLEKIGTITDGTYWRNAIQGRMRQ